MERYYRIENLETWDPRAERKFPSWWFVNGGVTRIIKQIERFSRLDMSNALKELQESLLDPVLDPGSLDDHLEILQNVFIDPFCNDFEKACAYLQRRYAAFAIVKSPWWRRAWIFQEFIMADRVYFLVNDGTQSHGSFVVATWIQLQSFVRRHFDNLERHAKFIDTSIAHMTEQQHELDRSLGITSPPQSDIERLYDFQRYSDHLWYLRSKIGSVPVPIRHDSFRSTFFPSRRQRKLEKQRLEQLSLRDDLDSSIQATEVEITKVVLKKRWVVVLRAYWNEAESMHQDWQIVKYMSSAKTAAKFPMRLSQLMVHASRCQSSDPRDKVYAFIGLADTRYGIEPVYDLPVNTVRTRLAKAIILVEGNLSFIASAMENDSLTTSNDPLPSWASDCKVARDSETDYRRFRRQAGLHGRQWRATPTMTPDVIFRKDQYGNQDRVLEIQCLYVDTLGKLVHDDYGLVKKFEGRYYGRSLRITVPSNCRVGDEVWILFGVEEPYVLRISGSEAAIVGCAMLEEVDGTVYRVSSIMNGSLYERYQRGENVYLKRLAII